MHSEKETCSLTISIGLHSGNHFSGECYYLRYGLITTILPPRLIGIIWMPQALLMVTM